MKKLLRAARLAAALAMSVSPALAQSSPDTLGYDAQALRLESHWGLFRIVKGADGPVVGTVGLFRPLDVEKLVAHSEPAAAEARVYRANHIPGSIAGTLGLIAFSTGVVIASNGSNHASSPILIIAGAGALGWGAAHLNAAYEALSKSIWWYNRDLKR